jgi:hypothetical protein
VEANKPRRVNEAAAVAAGAIVALAAVLQFSPTDWAEHLKPWVVPLALVACALVGLSVGIYWTRRSARGTVPEATSTTCAISYDEMKVVFQQLVELGAYDQLRIFGYTQEMVPEFLSWALRKRLDVFVLNRSWKDEEIEEKAHNAALAQTRPELRPWRKADNLRALAASSRAFAVRFYAGRPVIKAMLLSGEGRRAGFISFYHWKEFEGGSPYKGGSPWMVSMLYLRGETQDERNVLDYLASQFEVAWRNSKRGEDLAPP